MKKNCTYFFLCLTVFLSSTQAQVVDTLANINLFSKKLTDIGTAPVNVQQFGKDQLEKLNSLSVADAVKYFSGVVVKDYGGVGGLKTVSVRSLGANHTAVMYDGIVLGDAQGGQIDLGRLSLENIEAIQLFSNQPLDILMTARAYGSASVLALSSAVNNTEGRSASFRFKAGSFGFYNPSAYYRNSIGKKIRYDISAEYQSADGLYSFIDYETGRGKSKRGNADIKSYRIEGDMMYMVNDSNKLKLKLYYYDSKRGLPGSVILYNSFSNQRLNTNNFFGQFSWQNKLSVKTRILFNAKFSSDYKYYIDPAYPNNIGKLENEFYQKELFLSGAVAYKPLSSLTISYSSDYFRNSLRRTDQFAQGFANPNRDNFLNNLAIQFRKKRVEANANLLYTVIRETVKTGPVAKKLDELTPAIAVSYQPFISVPLRIRASFKKIFRAPTFDDLYYTNIGNTDLLPEYVDQYNLGITFSKQSESFLKEIVLSTDGYYNKVKDKILAVPRQNLFQWTMLNIGNVDIKGIDAAAHITMNLGRSLLIATAVSYSYQDARDMSRPGSSSYKTQIPYVPNHSGSASITAIFKKLSLSYNILASSYRYKIGDPIPENVVQGFSTHDVSISYTIDARKWRYKLLAETNNIYNTQYEIIKYYPMPRFNYRLGVMISLHK